MIDVAIIGAGAAGLATAIFTRRLAPGLSVTVFDGARRPGAKILVSGGGRCNVTNRVVSERDFNGGKPTVIRRVLRSLPVPDTIRFFQDLGVTLHEEAGGKLFPDSNRARDVLDALMRELRRVGGSLSAGTRVHRVDKLPGAFVLGTGSDEVQAHVVVLATGGQSLPKSGSDGAGFEMARRLGHTIVPTTPALVPLVVADSERAIHKQLAGVSHPAELAVWIDGRVARRLTGSLLWTHFGVSGPVALDASRHWLRGQLEQGAPRLTANFCPGLRLEEIDAEWVAASAARPTTLAATLAGERLPASVAAAIFDRLRIDRGLPLARLAREDRRRLASALTAWPLEVIASRGYTYAEATAGGIALDEIDPGTLASRRCPGLFLAGEILDVDGRLGGFNFQWAWASARAVATGVSGTVHPAGRR